MQHIKNILFQKNPYKSIHIRTYPFQWMEFNLRKAACRNFFLSVEAVFIHTDKTAIFILTTYTYNFGSDNVLARKSGERSSFRYYGQMCNFYCRTLDTPPCINERISFYSHWNKRKKPGASLTPPIIPTYIFFLFPITLK